MKKELDNEVLDLDNEMAKTNKEIIDLDQESAEILLDIDFDFKVGGTIYSANFKINYDNAIEAASIPNYDESERFAKMSKIAENCITSNEVNLKTDTKFKLFTRMCDTEAVAVELERFQNRATRRKNKSNTNIKPTI